MLFDFQFLDHSINRVGEIPCTFIEKCLTEDDFSLELFPQWFRNVISGLPSLQNKFNEVFLEIKELKKENLPLLQQLHDDLVLSYSISTLCQNTIIDPPSTKGISESLHLKIKALFNYFFETTLKDSKKLFTALGTTFNDHYRSFRTTNLGVLGKVCPMCGIHEYPLSANEPKAQYDHWLPQDIYPLLAINFSNIVPICGICNGIKHNKDLLFNVNDRTICFYPYHKNEGFSFTITDYTPVDELDDDEQIKYNYGKHIVEIIPINPEDTIKVESWDRVFDIKDRYTTYLSDYYYEIKECFKEYLAEKELFFQDGIEKNTLIDTVQQYQTHRIKSVRRETGAHLKNAYLDFICSTGNEYLLYTFFGIKLLVA